MGCPSCVFYYYSSQGNMGQPQQNNTWSHKNGGFKTNKGENAAMDTGHIPAPPRIHKGYKKITSIPLEERLWQNTTYLQCWFLRVEHQKQMTRYLNKRQLDRQPTLFQYFLKKNGGSFEKHKFPPIYKVWVNGMLLWVSLLLATPSDGRVMLLVILFNIVRLRAVNFWIYLFIENYKLFMAHDRFRTRCYAKQQCTRCTTDHCW